MEIIIKKVTELKVRENGAIELVFEKDYFNDYFSQATLFNIQGSIFELFWCNLVEVILPDKPKFSNNKNIVGKKIAVSVIDENERNQIRESFLKSKC